MRVPELVLAFLGIVLVYCGFHGCSVNETSGSCFDISIEFGISIVIDFYRLFVFTGFRTNPEGPFGVLRLECVFYCGRPHFCEGHVS